MPILPQSLEATKARRELWREQMVDFGSQISWLNDSSVVPAAATSYTEDNFEDWARTPYYGIATWMVDSLTRWSESVHANLSYRPTFDRHDLSSEERTLVRETIANRARELYSPGISGMAEICGVIPWLATREGRVKESWTEIADRSRLFGVELAKHGTFSQGLIRRYLYKPHRLSDQVRFDPSLLRLDETTGVSTVTPLDDMFEAASKLPSQLDLNYEPEDRPGMCVALQAPQEHLGGMTMFDAVWNTYIGALGLHVFPFEEINSGMIPDQKGPNPGIALTLKKIAEVAFVKKSSAEYGGAVVMIDVTFPTALQE